MTRNYKWLGWLTILASIIVACPVGAAPGDGDTAGLIKQLQLQVQKLQDSVDDLKKQLADAPTEGSVDAQIRKALAAPAADIYTLRQQVTQLQKDLNALKGTTRVAAYAPSGTGRIRLVN